MNSYGLACRQAFVGEANKLVCLLNAWLGAIGDGKAEEADARARIDCVRVTQVEQRDDRTDAQIDKQR